MVTSGTFSINCYNNDMPGLRPGIFDSSLVVCGTVRMQMVGIRLNPCDNLIVIEEFISAFQEIETTIIVYDFWCVVAEMDLGSISCIYRKTSEFFREGDLWQGNKDWEGRRNGLGWDSFTGDFYPYLVYDTDGKLASIVIFTEPYKNLRQYVFVKLFEERGRQCLFG